jgi:ribosome maturation factor RimP
MAGSVEKVREIAERVAQSSGLELVDLDLLGAGKARMLRIYIDKPGGVTHEDCAHYSREVGTIFDVEDAVPARTRWKFRRPVWTASCRSRKSFSASWAAW